MESVRAIGEGTALQAVWSPEMRRRLGKVYALLLRLPAPVGKTPSADQAARPGAPGVQGAMPVRAGQNRV